MTWTWTEMALAAGAKDEKEADMLLWTGSAFPFARPRTIWYQLRHTIRHRICLDDPAANCAGHKPWR